MSITANPFNHAGLRDLLMIEWEKSLRQGREVEAPVKALYLVRKFYASST